MFSLCVFITLADQAPTLQKTPPKNVVADPVPTGLLDRWGGGKHKNAPEYKLQ